MELNNIASRFGKFLSDNSPAILTGIAVAGTVTTAYLTGRATLKAAALIAEEEAQFDEEFEDANTRREIIVDRFLLCWKLYIPPVASGVATIACIIAVNQIGTRRAAALAAAYSLSEKAIEEYRAKVVEKIGEKKEKAYRTEIAQERITATPPESRLEDAVLIGDSMSVLCCDLFTGRYLLSDMETLRRASNDINFQVTHDYYASLSDFYDRIGLEHTSMSDDFGWNIDKLMELDFATVLTPSGKPCLTFNFTVAPIRGYHRLQ